MTQNIHEPASRSTTTIDKGEGRLKSGTDFNRGWNAGVEAAIAALNKATFVSAMERIAITKMMRGQKKNASE
jgi:hypothetical protein